MARYIDADAFYDELGRHKEMMEKQGGWSAPIIASSIDIVQRRIKGYPTADVAPVVHAHWIYQKGVFADDGTKGIFECSACKAIIDMQTFDLMYGCGQTRRCGSCGAKMEANEK